jgi:hypothetical protein
MPIVRGSLALAGMAVCCWLSVAPSAHADALLPSGQGVFTGLTGGSSRAFEAEVGKHPAVEGVFVTWGRRLESAFGQASFNHSRLMLHISTAKGYGAPEQITPRAIAQGLGDGYLLSLSARIVQSGDPVYIRLLPEMNNANNAYCAFNQDGSSRGASHSPASFRAAWRRVVLILRGGPIAALDARLRALGLPPVHGTHAAALPRPRVAFLWVPQTGGLPDTQANGPQTYYPGDAYVDWVGTDFYSRFPNFSGLQRFYSEHPGKPFVFGEWALWGGDDPGWVRQLFSFIASHRNVRMALYNQGERPNGPFRLTHYPQARRAIRQGLGSPRFRALAPEWEAAARARSSATAPGPSCDAHRTRRRAPTCGSPSRVSRARSACGGIGALAGTTAGSATATAIRTLVEAHQVLCEAGVHKACARAAQLADASAERFSDRLDMGPQFDAIYLHWMLRYGAQTGDPRWRALADEMASRALPRARDARGLYLRAWDGTPITEHQAVPNMLQTDAATLELFGWLGAEDV